MTQITEYGLKNDKPSKRRSPRRQIKMLNQRNTGEVGEMIRVNVSSWEPYVSCERVF